jgi:hypothetical protein
MREAYGRVYCTDSSHGEGEHNRGCIPPADPLDAALRLIRAIYGLCSLCDVTQDHEHDQAEYDRMTGKGRRDGVRRDAGD